MSNDKMTKNNSIMKKLKDALHKAWLKTAPSKICFKTAITKIYIFSVSLSSKTA